MATLNDLATAWWNWMVPMFWQMALLVVIVGLIDLAIRGWVWPQVRRALWLLVLVKLLVPPTFTLPTGIVTHLGPWAGPRIEEQLRGFLPTDETVATGPNTVRDAAPVSPEIDAALPGPSAQAAGATGTATPTWRVWLLGTWLAGMVFFALVLRNRIERLRRWHREQEERRTIPEWFHEILVGTAKRLDLDELPAIVFSDEVRSPAVYGLVGPVLLLPADYLTTLSREEAEHVLLHELAHLKRGDLLWHGLALVLQVVYWFNPFLFWARRQLKHVGEICCDLTVADTLREKTDSYRRTLLTTARALLTESTEPGLGLLGVFEDPFRLVARIKWLEKDHWRHRGATVVAVVCVLLVAVPSLLPMASPVGGEARAARMQTPDLLGGLGVSHQSEDGTGAAGLAPCYHLEETSRMEKDFLGIRFRREIMAVNEMWVRDDALAYTVGGWTVVADLARDRFLFIDHRHGTWAESALPPDVPDFIGEDLRDLWRSMRSEGRVEITDRHRDVLDLRCREYEITTWRARSDRDLRQFRVWAADEPPFDPEPFRQAMHCVRLIYNRSAEYRHELEKITGLQMRLEMYEKRGPIGIRYIDEIQEMTVRVPVRDVFAPPEDYERLELIEHLDF